MKINYIFIITALVALLSGCNCNTNVGKRIEAPCSMTWDNSKWISASDAQVVTGHITGENERAADGASWFVTEITNEKKVTSAIWMTTALGVYDIYINGKLIGNEILKPGFTHRTKTKRSFTYDITKNFNKATGEKNSFSAQVTPGWWADKIVTPGGNDGMIGKKCAFRSVIEITFNDGSKKLYGTDTISWKATVGGPVKHAAIFDGEEYDARELPITEYSDKLGTAEENREFSGEILPSDGAEIYFRKDLALTPVKAYTWKKTEGANEEEYGKVIIEKTFSTQQEMIVAPGETLVVDFGQNCAGVPSFSFKAKEGTEMTCLPSELLNDGNGAKKRGMDGPEGSCHRRNLRTPETGMILKYIFSDSKEFTDFTPRNTFFGFRLVSITATDTLHIKSIKSIPVTSITKEMEIGSIVTGNEIINKLISNAIWGQRSNYLSVPTDCPQRNERLGWTADTQVFTETGTFFANTLKFFHKWLQDLRDSQSDLGGYPGVAPTAQYGADAGNMMRVGWADAGIIVPWTIWKQFGDSTIIEESWKSMELFINHIDQTNYDHQTLSKENGNYQWGDWLSYEPLESCTGKAWGKNGLKEETIEYWNYLSSSYWIIDAEMMYDMAKATGKDTSVYKSMIKRAKDYTKERFLDSEGKFKVKILDSMQTPALFALKNGLVENEAKERMIERLRKNFEEHDTCLQTGFLGTSILMKTLTDCGMTDIAYELLFQHKNPSWLYSIDNGATTIWERWNSYTIESGMGPSGMNSFNHYAYGCVCAWIWETVCGIASDRDNPGFRHIIMKPVPDKRLGFVDCKYESANGTIKSKWRYEGEKWIWEFTIPEGSTATVTIPGENKTTEYKSGSYKIEQLKFHK